MSETGQSTILLVEDARELAVVIGRELEAAGYRVLRAGDGRTALELHARERPDLVILGWMLPKLSGIDTLRELRALAATPVLMLTARWGDRLGSGFRDDPEVFLVAAAD